MATIGRRDLAHRLLRRVLDGKIRLFLHHALDVLDDHDRVVDDDADREHQGQQRHGVGGIADRQQHREGADQADRDRDGGNDGRAQRTEEQEHDDHDEDEGLDEGSDDLADRVLHEARRVVDDGGLETLWKTLLQLGQRGVDGGGGRHRVGAWRQVDAERDRGLARQRTLGVLVLGSEFDAGDILDLEVRAVGVGPQHDIAELGGRREAALRLQVELELLVRGDRLGPDPTDRGLVVLRLDRVGDIGRREIQARQLLVSNQIRIE